jgi:hypothetical protein
MRRYWDLCDKIERLTLWCESAIGAVVGGNTLAADVFPTQHVASTNFNADADDDANTDADADDGVNDIVSVVGAESVDAYCMRRHGCNALQLVLYMLGHAPSTMLLRVAGAPAITTSAATAPAAPANAITANAVFTDIDNGVIAVDAADSSAGGTAAANADDEGISTVSAVGKSGVRGDFDALMSCVVSTQALRGAIDEEYAEE